MCSFLAFFFCGPIHHFWNRVSSIRKKHNSPQKNTSSQKVYVFLCLTKIAHVWTFFLDEINGVFGCFSHFPISQATQKMWHFFHGRHGRQWGSSYRDSDSEDGNDGDELSEVGWDGFSWNSGNQIGIWAMGKSIMTSVAGWSPQILLKK